MKKIIPFVIAAAIGFGIGTLSFCDRSYKLEEIAGKEYLCKRATKQCEIITDDFQLGSLEYRIEGIKKEMKEYEQSYR